MQIYVYLKNTLSGMKHCFMLRSTISYGKEINVILIGNDWKGRK